MLLVVWRIAVINTEYQISSEWKFWGFFHTTDPTCKLVFTVSIDIVSVQSLYPQSAGLASCLMHGQKHTLPPTYLSGNTTYSVPYEATGLTLFSGHDTIADVADTFLFAGFDLFSPTAIKYSLKPRKYSSL